MRVERFGSEEAIRQLPLSLQRLLTFERFHLHDLGRIQDTSRDPSFDWRYFPQNCGAFQLPCFWIARKHLYVYGDVAAASELSIFQGRDFGERVLFPVHPTSLEHYRSFLTHVGAESASTHGPATWAAPTSSTRTLLVWREGAAEKALFMKTSLHSPILGNRRLNLRVVARSIGHSRLIQESLPNLPDDLRYLLEPVGVVPRLLPDSGFIVRSVPPEIKTAAVVVAPLFSLIGGSAGHRPLFLTLVERSGISASQLVEEILCAQFAHLWLQMSMRFGLLLEAHGQDLLLALSPKLVPLGRFYYRDFEGVSVDWDLRQCRGLPQPKRLPRAWMWYDTYGSLGHRYQQLAWGKHAQSLLQYLHMVLERLDASLIQWQRQGVMGGNAFKAGDVTAMFSRHLAIALKEMTGVTLDRDLNIYRYKGDRRSLYGFAILLMKIRRQLFPCEPNRFFSRSGPAPR